MQVQVNLYENGTWEKNLDTSLDSENTLITVFSSKDLRENEAGFNELCEKFPKALITGCSTMGEIYQDELHDKSLSIAISKFEKTKIIAEDVKITKMEDSFQGGVSLAKKFDQKGLKALYILSEGVTVDGSNLVNGLNSVLNKDVIITGGIAGDAGEFKETWVFSNREAKPSYVSAIGFYGDNIHMNYTSEGGWNRFGLERLVTSCDSKINTIYTVDDKPILELYKRYMGEHAKNLPHSALEFPLLVIDKEGDSKIRAIFSADEESQSIRLYGDVKEGDMIVFLRGSPNYLIAGAQKAAENLYHKKDIRALALTVSCMGRRAVLKDQTEDEIEIITDVLGNKVSQVGFYSYGEISPQTSGKCALLNQTMTISLIWES